MSTGKREFVLETVLERSQNGYNLADVFIEMIRGRSVGVVLVLEIEDVVKDSCLFRRECHYDIIGFDLHALIIPCSREKSTSIFSLHIPDSRV